MTPTVAIDPCADPKRLEQLAAALRPLVEMGFGAIAIAGTYPCGQHDAHCAFAVGMSASVTAAELLALVDGLRAQTQQLAEKFNVGGEVKR